jgi:hypothetical protein
MDIFVSTLTQFLPQGDSFVGEIISGPVATWGGNPVFSGKEYLRTGLIKSYSSDYASLLTSLPTACVANQTVQLASGTGWDLATSASNFFNTNVTYQGVFNVYFLGGNYHIHYATFAELSSGGSVGVRFGASLSSTATTDIPLTVSSGSAPSYSYASVLFDGKIIIAAYQPTLNATGARIYRSTGASYTLSHNPSVVNTLFLAASSSLCIGAASAVDSTVNARIVTSPDGTTFTERVSDVNMGTCSRLCHSTTGNVFVFVNTAGAIWTSANGFNWTSRTAPTGMPTSLDGNAHRAYYAVTPTETYIMLGAPNTASTYILKTTNGTTFSLVDLATAGSGNLVGIFTGTSSAVPYLNYNGTYLYITYLTNRAYSTDGTNWTLDTVINQTQDAALNAVDKSTARYSDSNNVYYLFRSNTVNRIFNFTSKSFGATPDFVGSAAAVTFATGSNLSTFFRIK